MQYYSSVRRHNFLMRRTQGTRRPPEGQFAKMEPHLEDLLLVRIFENSIFRILLFSEFSELSSYISTSMYLFRERFSNCSVSFRGDSRLQRSISFAIQMLISILLEKNCLLVHSFRTKHFSGCRKSFAFSCHNYSLLHVTLCSKLFQNETLKQSH